MKKTYMNPSMNVLVLANEDILTYSTQEKGAGTVKTIEEILGM